MWFWLVCQCIDDFTRFIDDLFVLHTVDSCYVFHPPTKPLPTLVEAVFDKIDFWLGIIEVTILTPIMIAFTFFSIIDRDKC
jgi:hypothetical protein